MAGHDENWDQLIAAAVPRNLPGAPIPLWDALDERSWPGVAQMEPADIARVLGVYAQRVITPRGSTAVSGLELMTALRPPTRAVQDPQTGNGVPGHNPGSLGTEPMDPAPPEATPEHPVVDSGWSGGFADSVNRYRRGARKHARPDVAAKINDAVRQRWQPQVRKRRQQQAATATGITVETRARFGAPIGTTDDGRFRRLTVHLPPQYAQRLFDARTAGASDQQMRQIIAEGFREIYFQDAGARALTLSDVTLNDIDYLDLDC